MLFSDRHKRFAFWAGLALFLTHISLTAQAQTVETPDTLGTPWAQFNQPLRGKNIPVVIYQVAEVRSEAKDEATFVAQVAGALFRLTQTHGVEYCADIYLGKDGAFATRIMTIGAHTACPKLGLAWEGYELTGTDVHSHIHTTSFFPNDVDRLFLLGSYGPRTRSFTSPGFSDADFDSPGYMVDQQGLHWQHGKRRVSLVMGVDQLSQTGLKVISENANGDDITLVVGNN